METTRRETHYGIPEAPFGGPTKRERLIMLESDPAAGFLPTTNREEKQARLLLDYRTSSTGIIRSNKALNEIFRHQEIDAVQKLEDSYREQGLDPDNSKEEIISAGKEAGQKALVSVVFEWGDYLAQSSRQSDALNDLRKKVIGINPNISLTEELGVTHEGITPLIRFIELSAVRDGSLSTEPKLDRLRTVEIRHIDDSSKQKHKVVTDIYSGVKTKEFDESIIEKARSYKIGELQSIIKEAVLDQEKRRDFWKSRVIEARQHLACKPIAELVLAELGIEVE